MPSQSAAQQRLFGMVHAYQAGKLKDAPGKIKDVAAHIDPQDARDFARTKHEGLPERKEQEKEAQMRQPTLEQLTKLASFAEGCLKACAERDIPTDQAVAIMQSAARHFAMEKLALDLSDGTAWSQPGPAVMQTQKAEAQAQNQAPGQNPGQQQVMQPEPAAAPPTHPFDFANDHDVRMALAIRKDHMKKKMKETQKHHQQMQVNTGQAPAPAAPQPAAQ